MSSCSLCTPGADQIFHAEDPLYLCLWDSDPVSPGHALVITRRHVPSWFDATLEEREALIRGIDVAYAAILRRHQPSGFSISISVGVSAGQSVPHVHAEIIPRYDADLEDSQDEVRDALQPWATPRLRIEPPLASVVGERSARLQPSQSRKRQLSRPDSLNPLDPPLSRPAIVGSDTEPFLPHLLADLKDCRKVDLAVAFILPSGLALIRPYLEDILDRGGTIRLVTGDYLGVTDPVALLTLLDLMSLEEPHGTLTCRVFETDTDAGFHPKVYLIHEHSAYVGSSNLTRPALSVGLESNYRVDPERDPKGFEAALREFDSIFGHPKTRPLTEEWVHAYVARRKTIVRPPFAGVPEEPPLPPPAPHVIQVEALEALRKSREDGNRAGLVVLATGLGKTWLSAFDSVDHEHILFVAHREEILRQARDTYRRIRPNAQLGLFTGQIKDREADVLFASIQTLARRAHLETFPRDHFDYIVVDEFHHATAATYRRLLSHFEPEFLLGLTATPERSDGGDLLALCLENLVYRCDLLEGIRRDLLCPFHYFGVPDEVDYANIPWRSGRFDPEALELAVATNRRAENALGQWRRFAKPGTRTLAFCVSTRHADFMRDYFRERGVSAAAVHSESSSDSRAASLEELEKGNLEVVFCVDMFNEGVDLPSVDSILMLRPTESRVLWLQQVGRGLRKQEGKTLRIVDYVGNHRTFLRGILTLLPLEDDTPAALVAALARVERHELSLPPGCEVTYDLEALSILRALVPASEGRESIRQWYEEFRDRHGLRPTASEAWHAGYDPKGVRRHDGSWLGFVNRMHDLSPEESAAFTGHRSFFETLETTPMNRSDKMLLLSAWIAEGSFPDPIALETLVDAVGRLIRRSHTLQRDVGEAHSSPEELRALLERDAVPAWTGGEGAAGTSFLAYDGKHLKSRLGDSRAHAAALRALTQELVDWRLAQYLARGGDDGPTTRFVCRVSHAGDGKPILFLPDRKQTPGLPVGEMLVVVDGETLVADFVKVALNVVHREGATENLLPEILRRWFGPEAGAPGHGPDRVLFEWQESGYGMRPVGGETEGPVLWKEYAREKIPELWGLPFQGNLWRQGFVQRGQHIFLLVTLEKANLPEEHRYADRFLSPERFEWQSQNRTTRGSKAGQDIAHHSERGLDVHLFVRRSSKTLRGTATPFTYCGAVDFIRWDGDQPITVEWQLRTAVPEHLWRGLNVPGRSDELSAP